MPEIEAIPATDLPTGSATMSPAMAEMQAYPRYLFDRVAQHMGRRVWEIGVGYGTYTTWLRDAGKTVLATDIDRDCVRAVEARFAGDPQVRAAQVDLTRLDTVGALSHFHADSVLCFNVLEHIEDDVAALTAVREAIVPQAVLGLIVPAHPQLYGRMDSEAGHFRRYTRRSLQDVLNKAGWQVRQLRYLNLLGALGWWYHNRCRKSAGLGDDAVNSQMRMMDRWLPRMARLTDPICSRLAGLSVLAIANAAPLSDEADPSTIPSPSADTAN